ncbi:EF-P 5-aminopentanol modification-associated protein YfmF [Oceanobacillus sp. 1P07AA]|uniref:EF-P 5-aminopentanol modification-associated protein YfmF n=1 Tax=Oceanobacillus sp. 1P07AA TaxID=3132293 RepID=UPI0039A51419
MKVQVKQQTINGMKFHFVPNKKHKTISFVAKLRAPLQRDTITKRALLPYVLKQGTASFPTRVELQKELDELYGAILSITGGKKGENHILTIRLEVANEKFIPDASTVMRRAAMLFEEVLFQLNGEGTFKEEIFEREKKTLLQKIHALKDDKMNYANTRLIDEMCEDEPYSIHVQGYEDDLISLQNEGLFAYAKSIIKEDIMDVYVTGDFQTKEMMELLEELLSGKTELLNESASPTKSSSYSSSPKEIVEEDSVQQAKLHIGYRTNILYDDPKYAALQVFNGLFGAFPSSKLFINVREKNSLAYYASSRLESHKGLMIVMSGIAPEDYEKARDIIREQVEEMKSGSFTDEEFEETKQLIINQLLETMDHPQGLVELLYQQEVGGKSLPPEQLISDIKSVSKQQVIEVAKEIEEDTVYLLTSKGGEKNE